MTATRRRALTCWDGTPITMDELTNKRSAQLLLCSIVCQGASRLQLTDVGGDGHSLRVTYYRKQFIPLHDPSFSDWSNILAVGL